MLGLFRPSGGLRYHLRSRRYAGLWGPFQSEIAKWLNDWEPDYSHLLLLGPSAAYTLPTAWLKKFTRIDAYDLDPLAPWIFRFNHPGVSVQFHRKNLFWQDGVLSTGALTEILREHPKASILFSNILGQVLLEGHASEREWSDFLLRLRHRLQYRSWASYHDLFTHEDGAVIDHLMRGEWSQGLESRQFVWQLTPDSRHIIEGVSQKS